MDRKDDKYEKIDTPCQAQNTGRPLSVGIDVEKYQSYLDDVDLSDEQKKELLEALWMIMRTFIDIGFGLHPLQQVLPEDEQNVGVDPDDANQDGKGI